MSKRFGQPKQMLKFKGRYLIERVLDTALKSNLNSIVLVLGKDYKSILQALANKLCNPEIEIVINHKYEKGQSASLKAGLLKAKKRFSSVMFLMADQPMLNSKTINTLLNRFSKSQKHICVPVCQGNKRSPTIFSSKFYERLFDIQGDIGARNIIISNPEEVLFVDINTPPCFFDIDTKKDMKKLERCCS